MRKKACQRTLSGSGSYITGDNIVIHVRRDDQGLPVLSAISQERKAAAAAGRRPGSACPAPLGSGATAGRAGQGAGWRGPRSHTLTTPCHAPVCVWYGTYTPVWYIHAVNPARLPARSLSSGTLSEAVTAPQKLSTQITRRD